MALQSSFRLALRRSSPALAQAPLVCCTCLAQPSTSSLASTAAAAAGSTSTPLSVRYASTKGKASAPAKKKSGAFSAKSVKKGAGEAGSESKSEALRKYLYGDDASARKAHDLERFEALTKVIPDLEVHETIVRAWQLHKRHLREEHEQEIERRYASMQGAIVELEKTSKPLFDAAVHGPKFSTVRGTKGEAGKRASAEGRIEGLFPRQLPVLR